MRKVFTTALAAVMAATSFVTVGVTASDAQPGYWRGDRGWHGRGWYGPRPFGPRYGYYGPRYGYYGRYHH
ncbi:hypothetical protein J8J40_32770, partial [Mycobacterium tuberculosis]|nr:hypothetical protein [Mycobacterium tuberculosis]